MIRWGDNLSGRKRNQNFHIPVQQLLNYYYGGTAGDVSPSIGRESEIDDSEGVLSMIQTHGRGASSPITSDGQGVNSTITSVNT